MPRIELTAEEDLLAERVGRAVIKYLKLRGLTSGQMRECLARRYSTPLDLARTVCDERGDAMYLLSHGMTSEIRLAAVRNAIRQFPKWTNPRSVRYISYEIMSQAIGNSDHSIRAAIVQAFPLAAHGKYLRNVIFHKNQWRTDQRRAVREAVIYELARRGCYRTLMRIVQEEECPKRYVRQIMKHLRQDNLAHLARHAEPYVAEMAMGRITDQAILEKLRHFTRPAVRNTARKKLGLPVKVKRFFES